MKNDDELWLKKIKERLDDYSEPLPAAGWERLEKALPASASVGAGMQKRILFRRWAMTAAAAVLVAVTSVSLWFLQSPMVDDVRHLAEPALAVIPDVLPEPAKPAGQTEQLEPVIRRVPVSRETSDRRPLVAQRVETEEVAPDMMDVKADKDAATRVAGQNEGLPVSDANDTEAIGQEAEKASATTTEQNVRRMRRPSGKDKLHLPVEKKSSGGGKGWSVGLSVGNTGGLVSQANSMDNLQQSGIDSGPMFNNKVDMTSVSNGILNIPEGNEVVFEGGVPYLRKVANDVKDIKHKQPISFGLAVRKNLPKGFSVETGVTYTMLASEIQFEGTGGDIDQKLHYIGIPVRANWNFLNGKNFTMYVSAGGAIEKCIYGKIGTERETVKPVQLSLMGAVGAQYNISKRVGLYVEPGVSHFFDDGSLIETIRKENPTNFTLQAGIRLTY